MPSPRIDAACAAALLVTAPGQARVIGASFWTRRGRRQPLR
ncbi:MULTISPECIES: hypothetical protein [unclassified Sphingomonas]|nr:MULTISPECIES: hypothetical protein [unclassified Sphingomonas]